MQSVQQPQQQLHESSHDVISRSPNFAGPAETVAIAEGEGFSKARARAGLTHNNYQPCRTFRGERNHCAMEWDLWVMVEALITPAHTVIEFGARYGTTSCAIAAATGNSGRVVSVDPDASARDAMLHNRAAHRCNYHAVHATVGPAPLVHMSGHGYAMKTGFVKGTNASQSPGTLLPHVPLHELERRLDLRFNAAIIDCEGCIGSVLGGPRDGAPWSPLLGQLDLLLLEEGIERRVKGLYRRWHRELRERGFEQIWRSRDTMDLSTAWSQNLYYTAWQQRRRSGRPDLATLPEFKPEICAEHGRRMNYTDLTLQCCYPTHCAPWNKKGWKAQQALLKTAGAKRVHNRKMLF